jgi:hypothetical protein
MVRLARISIVGGLLAFISVALAQERLPRGLQPGDNYYLIFVTDTERDATSMNIADYNTFVSNEAARAPALAGITWRAIVSTAQTSAATNLGMLRVAPVYLLDGQTEVLAQARTIFSGRGLEAAISVNQFGRAVANLSGATAWTGTLPDGTGDDDNVLGKELVSYGRVAASDNPDWIQTSSVARNNARLHIYAISNMLTYPVRTGPPPKR